MNDAPHARDENFAHVVPINAGKDEHAGGGKDDDHPLRGMRILVIDDSALHRENLLTVLGMNGAEGMSAAWDLRSLVTALERAKPDIVLLNVATPAAGLLLRETMEMAPGVRVIVLGLSEDDESEVVAYSEAGVVGYHLRSETLDDLLVVVQQVAAGESSFSPTLAAMLLRRLSALASRRQQPTMELALTVRETQILRMLELGRSNHDIASELAIAVHTVKNHVHSLLKKLGVGSRAEAAALSRSLRLRQD